MKRTPITTAGAKRLHEELERLKTVERPRIVKAIAEARAHGDLSENAEYHAAREQQGFVEGRIRHVEAILSQAHIIDPCSLKSEERVVFGATLSLRDESNGTDVTYQIVGELEADVIAGRISVTSPIGRALIGKEEGDTVEVEVPDGVRSWEILEIRYE